MNWWNKEIENDYERMLYNHEALWEWIKKFITDNNIKSLLDVGAGMTSPVKNIVPDYLAVDVNEKTDAIHEDFATMDSTPFIGRFDLILIAGVVEHQDGYDKFFEQIVKFKPKYSIVTFFHGLGYKQKELVRKKPIKGDPLFLNRYSKVGVKAKLDSLGLEGKYDFFIPGDMKRNTLVLISF